MHQWIQRAIAAASFLLLTGCLWGPGKFQSTLTIKNDRFTLDYSGEMILDLPPDAKGESKPWDDKMAFCPKERLPEIIEDDAARTDEEARPCTKQEIADLKTQYAGRVADRIASKTKENSEMARMFGLGGVDDTSARDFATKLMKYAGWRSVTYRGNGKFDVVYHGEGRANQDFIFPALPDNDLILPFIAIRRRADGSILVTAPAFTGGQGPLAARGGMGLSAMSPQGGPESKAEGRFTIITDGEVLTNNSEDGPQAAPGGKALVWNVNSTSAKIPEALIKLR
jgi:hypothetical protein